MKHVFIIGSKGIPAQYGGFETFVERLTANRTTEEIQYYVACMDKKEEMVSYNGANCFHLNIPSIGPAKAVYYDMKAFSWCLSYIKEHKIEDAVVYVLACRIGPFVKHYKKKLNALGGKLYVNPDGHEWKRAKWNYFIRKYWKYSERLMVKHAELLVCDSKNIEAYIREDYRQYTPNTTYIAYGADEVDAASTGVDEKLLTWYDKHGLQEKAYYLVVGRFVPENNYETMIREFMASKTTKDFVLITNVENNKFYNKLLQDTRFDQDKRIKFVGTVYDERLLQQIRVHAYGYLHGHEVGGTNPSLLEALGSTDLNLLLDVGFNSEVGKEGALYWEKKQGDLKSLIERADTLNIEEIQEIGAKAHSRIKEDYSWSFIVNEYESLFING